MIFLNKYARKDYDELQKNIANLQEQVNMARFKINESSKRISELKEERLSFINQFKDTKYQELLTLKKELQTLAN